MLIKHQMITKNQVLGYSNYARGMFSLEPAYMRKNVFENNDGSKCVLTSTFYSPTVDRESGILICPFRVCLDKISYNKTWVYSTGLIVVLRSF